MFSIYPSNFILSHSSFYLLIITATEVTSQLLKHANSSILPQGTVYDVLFAWSTLHTINLSLTFKSKLKVTFPVHLLQYTGFNYPFWAFICFILISDSNLCLFTLYLIYFMVLKFSVYLLRKSAISCILTVQIYRTKF